MHSYLHVSKVRLKKSHELSCFQHRKLSFYRVLSQYCKTHLTKKLWPADNVVTRIQIKLCWRIQKQSSALPEHITLLFQLIIVCLKTYFSIRTWINILGLFPMNVCSRKVTFLLSILLPFYVKHSLLKMMIFHIVGFF